MKVLPGKSHPLGATWDGAGVNFALFSENASKVELCLFEHAGATSESKRIPITERTDQVWHAYLPNMLPGQLYGYRVHGDYEPEKGFRFNPNKIVLDPYARSIGRDLKWDDSLFGYTIGKEDMSFDQRDSAPYAPLAVVIDQAFTWGDDQSPRTPWHKTLIYELHPKGFTKLNPNVPEKLRGTYSGIASEASIEHLLKLNVTAIEIMPVHHHVDDRHLLERKLFNYWGYNTLAFFAPDLRYASNESPLEAVRQFKMMVRTLHAAGIEVILDVVYNHTAEGNQLGPTLSMRGIDNFAYYRLSPENPRYYTDYTGCGNTLNMVHPRVLQLIMDSLRYWVLEMHVDGFRFDLASTLARELHAVNRLSAFFDIIHQDPILSQVKLIAEPWDVGEGGYQVGNFPVLWTEWNGKYRDNVRQFWKGDGKTVSELATRFAGSSDLYEQSGRRPYASINFVTCHDGMTMADLVSYNDKHNESNGENNKDGTDNNLSWNCGAEGDSDDPAILELRRRQRRNFFATLLFSQGVPMICGGDELGQTYRGNNNTYCQDNELTWLHWDMNEDKREFLDFVRLITHLRNVQPVFQRRRFFQGRAFRGSDIKDISWLDPSGNEMSDEAWNSGKVECLGVRLAGDLIGDTDERGERIVGETFIILLNAHHEQIQFCLPDLQDAVWQLFLDTAEPKVVEKSYQGSDKYPLVGRSLAVLGVKSTIKKPIQEQMLLAAEEMKLATHHTMHPKNLLP